MFKLFSPLYICKSIKVMCLYTFIFVKWFTNEKKETRNNDWNLLALPMNGRRQLIQEVWVWKRWSTSLPHKNRLMPVQNEIDFLE